MCTERNGINSCLLEGNYSFKASDEFVGVDVIEWGFDTACKDVSLRRQCVNRSVVSDEVCDGFN